jgi:hypothetical protein
MSPLENYSNGNKEKGKYHIFRTGEWRAAILKTPEFLDSSPLNKIAFPKGGCGEP